MPTWSSTSACSIRARRIIEPLRPVRAHILLADGVLTIADFDGVTAAGPAGRLPAARRARHRGAVDRRHARPRHQPGAVAAPEARQGTRRPTSPASSTRWCKVKGAGRSDRGDPGQPRRRHPHPPARRRHLAPRHRGGRHRHRPGARRDRQGRRFAADPVQRRRSRRRQGCRAAEGVRLQHQGLDDLDRRHGVAQDRGARSACGRLAERLQPACRCARPIHVKGVLGKPACRWSWASSPARPARRHCSRCSIRSRRSCPFIDPGAKEAAKEAGAQCANLVKTSGMIPMATLTPNSVHVPPAPLAKGASAPR